MTDSGTGSRTKMEEKLAAALERAREEGIFVAVEGTISVGKSWFMDKLRASLEHTEFIREPLDLWRRMPVQDGPFAPVRYVDVFAEFHRDPVANALPFQQVAHSTRAKLKRESFASGPGVRVSERSLIAGDCVFARLQLRLGTMTDTEFAAYTAVTEVYKEPNSYSDIEPDVFFFLRASPEVCFARYKKRQRDGEFFSHDVEQGGEEADEQDATSDEPDAKDPFFVYLCHLHALLEEVFGEGGELERQGKCVIRVDCERDFGEMNEAEIDAWVAPVVDALQEAERNFYGTPGE